MIDVKVTEPMIMITCGIGNEESVCSEVLDILFSYGIEARCSWFSGRGFVVVYMERQLNVYTVVRYIVSRNVRGYWVIPIDFVCSTSYEHIARSVVDAILLKGYRLPIKAIGRCRKRGNIIDSCSSLLRYIGNIIENLGIAVIDFRNYEYIIRIEVVYENTFISIYSRSDENLFRIKRPNVI
ncbi:MAG: THUMP domain-containing protein [Ignisphaera sp.]|uniref:THUMP domain-containing protein n=1 Tax=Ignisphaera aggregans TaxID=334771 RepID=A0A7J3MWW0_9CREN